MLRKDITLGGVMAALMLFLSLVGTPDQVNADAGLALGVNPQLPANQVDSQHGYFDLQVKPDAKQTLVVALSNGTKEPIDVSASVNTAKTNQAMQIEYGPNKLKSDRSLQYDLPSLLKGPKKVTIPARTTKEVRYKLTVPKTAFLGSLAGGITFTVDHQTDGAAQQKKDGMLNRYSYVVGVVLREDTHTKVKPELTMPKVKAGSYNARNAILVTLVNDQPTFIKQLSTRAVVTKRDSDKKIIDTKQKGQNIAPNSRFTYALGLGDNKKLKPGKYRLQLTVKNHDYTWHLKRDFTITDAQAKQLNKHDVSIERPNYLVIILVLLVLGGLLTLPVYLIKKNRK